MGAASKPSPHAARVLYQGRAIPLPPGNHLVGRAPSCRIVLDERSVSRRHACIRVAGHGVSIEDLGSANGVFVNGQRVIEPEPLEDGDAVIIGEEELVMCIAVQPLARTESGTLPTPLPASTSPQGSIPQAATERVNAFTLLAVVAERALAAGDAAHAEQIVEPRLLGILRDAERDPSTLDEGALDRAVRLALALAEHRQSRRWLEYALDLLTIYARPCSERVAAALGDAKRRAGSIDASRLDAYARAIRKLTASTHTMRTLRLIEELAD